MSESKSGSFELTKESCVEVVTEWKHFWMNQKQNDEADYQNYLHRAIGVDANMKYHLADLFFDHASKALAASNARNVILEQRVDQLETELSEKPSKFNIESSDMILESKDIFISELQAANTQLTSALEVAKTEMDDKGWCDMSELFKCLEKIKGSR